MRPCVLDDKLDAEQHNDYASSDSGNLYSSIPLHNISLKNALLLHKTGRVKIPSRHKNRSPSKTDRLRSEVKSNCTKFPDLKLKSGSETGTSSQSSDDIYRKYRVAIKQTEDYIKSIHDTSEDRIHSKHMDLSMTCNVEDCADEKSEAHTTIKRKYVMQVDCAVENKQQYSALVQYHRAKISHLLPDWVKKISAAITVIRGQGHNDALQWRSAAKGLLKEALVRSDDDCGAHDSRVALRRLIVTVNAHKAQRLITKLINIQENYIKSLDSSSSLGQHCRQLNAMLNERNGDPVPLSHTNWSVDLQKVSKATMPLDMSPKESTLNLFTDPNTAECSDTDRSNINAPLDDASCRRAANSVTTMNTNSASADTKKTPRFAVTDGLVLSRSLQSGNTYSLVAKQLREAATDGRLRDAWNIFNAVYGEFIVQNGDKAFLKRTLRIPPSLVEFKVLVCAYKNSSSDSFDDVKNIFEAMGRARVVPDVSIFNMVLKACEMRCAWRRAIQVIGYMQEKYDITPNTHSYTLLIDCCRHAVDTPAVVYETLRNKGFPHELCYQAAACNAGNRVSNVAALHAFNDALDDYHRGSLESSSKCFSSSNSYPDIESDGANSRIWDCFNNRMRQTLQPRSPAKHLTGTSHCSFNEHISRTVIPIHQRSSCSSLLPGIALEGSDIFDEHFFDV